MRQLDTLSTEQIIAAFLDLDVSSATVEEYTQTIRWSNPSQFVACDPNELRDRFNIAVIPTDLDLGRALVRNYCFAIKAIKRVFRAIGELGNQNYEPDLSTLESHADVKLLLPNQLACLVSKLDIKNLIVDTDNHREIHSKDELSEWILTEWFRSGNHFLSRVLKEAIWSADSADYAYAEYKLYIKRQYNAEAVKM